MSKILRIFLIILLAVSLVLTAALFRMPNHVNEAQADIWELFEGVIRDVPRYFRSFEGRGETRMVEINDNKLFYTNTMTTDSPKQVMDYYYEQYYKPEIKILSEKTREAIGLEKHPGAVKFFDAIDRVINSKISRVFRKEGEGYGLLAYLDMGNKDFFDHYIKAGNDFARTGNLDYLGVGKAVIAIEDSPGKTTVLNFWTGPGFNVKNMASNGRDDAKGEDIDNVPRPPDGVRTMSTRETDSLAKVKTVVYKSSMNKNQLLFYYLDALRQEGWVKSQAYEEVDVKTGDNDSMIYFKKDRELTVSIQESDPDGSLVVAVHRRF